MTADRTPSSSPQHVLVYECRIVGHHLPWLRMVTEDLLSGGIRVSLAVPQHAEAQRRLNQELGQLLDRVPRFPITENPTEPSAARQLRRAAELLGESGADTVFFCCLD